MESWKIPRSPLYPEEILKYWNQKFQITIFSEDILEYWNIGIQNIWNQENSDIFLRTYWNTVILENFNWSIGILESWKIQIFQFIQWTYCNIIILGNSTIPNISSENIRILKYRDPLLFQYSNISRGTLGYFQRKYWTTGILENSNIPIIRLVEYRHPGKFQNWNIWNQENSNVSIFSEDLLEYQNIGILEYFIWNTVILKYSIFCRGNLVILEYWNLGKFQYIGIL